MRKLFFNILLILTVPVVIMLFNYVVDPMQFFRQATTYQPVFYDQQRYQNPAIARTYDYDTVIVGTSMSENISLTELKEQYGLNAVRLTVSGSSSYEQLLGLSVALETGKVKNVIWELNYASFSGKANAVRDKDAVFPYYLYDGNPLTNFKYLLDPNVTSMSWNIAKSRNPYNAELARQDLENLNKWANWNTFGREKTLDSFEKSKNAGEFARVQQTISDYDITQTSYNFDKNVFKVFEDNPDINWYFYFPPFSVLEHVGFELQGIFEDELKWRAHVFERFQPYSVLFDLQTDKDIITNFNLYKDKAHHNTNVTTQNVEQILHGTPTNAEDFAKNQQDLQSVVMLVV